tara:strand:+ start:7 stop:165 length:159 start_codon:yes stop_codon:yes gene_type:complete
VDVGNKKNLITGAVHAPVANKSKAYNAELSYIADLAEVNFNNANSVKNVATL